jgi:hypothetical protein
MKFNLSPTMRFQTSTRAERRQAEEEGHQARLKTAPVLNPSEAGEFLGIGKHRLWRLIVTGSLEAFNVATQSETRPVYRITRKALDEFMARSTVKPKALVRGKAGMKIEKA